MEFKINLRYRKGYTDILVGQCRQFPFIIVEGHTVDELVDEILYELEAYFNTFPEQGKKALEKYGKEAVDVPEEVVAKLGKEEEEEGWNQKEILAPIPIRS